MMLGHDLTILLLTLVLIYGRIIGGEASARSEEAQRRLLWQEAESQAHLCNGP